VGGLGRLAAAVEGRVDAHYLGFHHEGRIVSLAHAGIVPTTPLGAVEGIDLGGAFVDRSHLAHFVEHVLARLGKRLARRVTGGARLIGAVKQFLEIVLNLLAGAARLLDDAGDAVFAFVCHELTLMIRHLIVLTLTHMVMVAVVGAVVLFVAALLLPAPP
jgi:hypothetical protein